MRNAQAMVKTLGLKLGWRSLAQWSHSQPDVVIAALLALLDAPLSAQVLRALPRERSVSIIQMLSRTQTIDEDIAALLIHEMALLLGTKRDSGHLARLLRR